MLNPDETSFANFTTSNAHDDYCAPPGAEMELTAEDYAQLMIQAIIDNRKPDNGAGDEDPINHDAERLGAGFFTHYLSIFKPAGMLDPLDMGAFHLIYGLCRIIVCARRGKVNLNKVVDMGGWAQVLADAAKEFKCGPSKP